MDMRSPAEMLKALAAPDQQAFLATLSDDEAEELLHDWRGFLARPDQIAPEGDWDIWLALAGRGWGKTEVGGQWTREQAHDPYAVIALVAETAADARDVMVSRILRVSPDAERPDYEPSKRRLTWPNGAVAFTYNGTEPDQLRGPEHSAAWTDELAKYRYARETWDQLQFGLRVGSHPRSLVTTTPRPIEIIKAIVAGQEGKVHVTRGTTYDNAANLPERFLDRIKARYEGTRLGRQELRAEILGDLPGALWPQSVIDTYRLHASPNERALKRVVVAVDPAVTATEDSDEHGIILAALTDDDIGVVLADESLSGSPTEWARRAVSLYKRHRADALVVEVNQGGDMVVHTIRTVDPTVNVVPVRATRGKHVRAEPIAALYEQGRIAHVGQMPALEAQLTQFTVEGYQGEGSPDRADALVWAMTALFPGIADPIGRRDDDWDDDRFADRNDVTGY